MPTLAVVEYLYILKNSSPGFFPSPELSQMDQLVFDRAEKGLCSGVVVAVALAAHAAKHTVLGQYSLIILAAVLDPTIRMVDKAYLRMADAFKWRL
ncbi:MAG: hypothetical protein DDT21_01828 [Syntrophomonadaceae bacterium]|nr:hypothetical protein [Bacillota bacterium]